MVVEGLGVVVVVVVGLGVVVVVVVALGVAVVGAANQQLEYVEKVK